MILSLIAGFAPFLFDENSPRLKRQFDTFVPYDVNEENEMAYESTLELAGADVYDFNTFGTWQGTWCAHVGYNGKVGFVFGEYGSCSGCDAFQAEFGCSLCDEHDEFVDGCEQCQLQKDKMIEFGKGYLENILDSEEALKFASKDIEWDLNAVEMVAYIKERIES